MEVIRLFCVVGFEFFEIVKVVDELCVRVNGENVRILWIFWKDMGDILV